MKKIFSIIALALLTVVSNTTAQGISVQDERQFNLKVYRMLDAYESLSGMYDTDERIEFMELFTSPDLLIYNDLMGLSSQPELSVADYVSTLAGEAKSIRAVVKNIRKGDITEQGDNWAMTVTFQKSIVYSKCGVLLSASDYYGADYDMVAQFIMDKETQVCRIASLKGSINSQVERFPDRYEVLQKTNDRDTLVKCNGTTVRFNNYEQAVLPANYNLSYYDGDVKMKVVREDRECNLVTLKYTPLHRRLKPRVEMSMGDYFKVENDGLYSDVATKSSEMNFGLDLGYVFPSKGNFKVGIYVGAALSKAKLDFTMDALNYNYNAPASADVDGDTYVRYYELSNIAQSVEMTDLMVPAYFDFELRFGKAFSLAMQLGAKSYFNLSSSVTSSMDAYTYGIYPQYQNLRMEETWLNNFGRHTLGNESLTMTEVQAKSCYDAFAGLSARVKLVGPLSLEVGANYQMGLTDCIGSDDDEVVAVASASPGLAHYYVNSGERVTNLTQHATSIKHNALKLNAGLILKF